jgi:ABC-type Fe3+ transport system substrate-binding protein
MGQADAGVTWASEVRFQESFGNPIQGIVIPTSQNTTAIYAGAVMADAPHADVAAEWLAFLKRQQAQAIYHKYGFHSTQHSSNWKGRLFVPSQCQTSGKSAKPLSSLYSNRDVRCHERGL